MDPNDIFTKDKMLEVSESFFHIKKGISMVLNLPSPHILRLHVIGTPQNWPFSFLTFWTK